MNIEDAIRKIAETKPGDLRREELGRLHEAVCEETGFPWFLLQDEFSKVKALSRIGKTLYFRDLENLWSGQTREEKAEAVRGSVNLMRECADPRAGIPAQAAYDESIRRFYQGKESCRCSEEIRSRCKETFRPLEGEVPTALAGVYAKAADAFETALNLLAEVEEFEATGEEPDEDLVPFPEKDELEYDAARAAAQAEAVRRIAMQQRTMRASG